jgi:methanogenic corrinoid protein MtbC1
MEPGVDQLREHLLREAAELAVVPRQAADAFARQAAELASRVRSARMVLFGLGAVGAPAEGHDVELDHAAFMRRLLDLGDYRLLVSVLPSIYRASKARGLPDDDNRIMLDVWIQALGVLLPGEYADPVRHLYRWMRDHHADWVRLAEERPAVPAGAAEWSEARAGLVDALVRGDQSGALELARRATTDPSMLRHLYTQAVTPALYEIGGLWETGEMTVAEEHRASEIMARVVDICSGALSPAGRTKGRAFVTAAPGERHSLGARIVADILEMDGWDVTYVGATSPAADLAYLAASTRPNVIGISVAMASNLPQLATLVRELRALPHLAGARIMVGGWLLVTEPDVWRLLGADAGATDADGALELASAWWAEQGG